MMNIAIVIKSLMFWKFRTITLPTENGLEFVGVGKPEAINKFETLLQKKHLKHLRQEQKKAKTLR